MNIAVIDYNIVQCETAVLIQDCHWYKLSDL